MKRLSRRAFIESSLGATLAVVGVTGGCQSRVNSRARERAGEWVNDVHSGLNATRVSRIARPDSRDGLARLVESAHRQRASISICGGRHAGGGQQFRKDQLLVDLSALDRVLEFDPIAGTIRLESGIRWPAVIDFLHAHPSDSRQWAIHQKQGGADELSLGGAVASNIHGRCLASRPIVQDIVSLDVVTPDGQLVTCDREHDSEHFAHIVGGYGLFGVVYAVTLRLQPRRKLVRRVQWLPASEAIGALESNRDAGAWHGDFQFCVDETKPDFCTAGLCSWYVPVPDDKPVTTPPRDAGAEQFRQLVALAHQDKSAAWTLYRDAVLGTDGKAIDWSDRWQRGDYVAGYHSAIDPSPAERGSEILSELYVPREALAPYLEAAARILRESGANLVYGTVRLIERDTETVLAWARHDYACVIFNLHTRLTSADIEHNADVFRRLLDAAIALDGSYYLTYHRFARRDQIVRCHPRLREFLAAKHRYDSRETLDSDWYRHYRDLLK